MSQNTDTSDFSITILVCGKTGVGKSTLVNAILGAKFAQVGGPGSSVDKDDAMSPVTSGVTKHCKLVRGVIVTVYDTPGLQDTLGKDEEYLAEMKQVIEEANLILYCFEMTAARILEPDKAAIELVSTTFGLKFWTKAIVVLTKANMFQYGNFPEDDEEEKKKWEITCEDAFNDISSSLKTLLHGHFPDHNFEIEKIGVIAAGNAKDKPAQRKLIFVAPGVKHADYLGELITVCLETISNPKATASLASAIGCENMKISGDNQIVAHCIEMEASKADVMTPLPEEADVKTSLPEEADVKTSEADVKTSLPEEADVMTPLPEEADVKIPLPEKADVKTSLPEEADVKTPLPEKADETQRTVEPTPSQAKRITRAILGAILHAGGARLGPIVLARCVTAIAVRGGVVTTSTKLGAILGTISGGFVGTAVGVVVGTAAGMAIEEGIKWAYEKPSSS